MPLYLDIHSKIVGMTPDALEALHKKDLELQEKYGVRYLKYWYDMSTQRVFCLVEAPDMEAAERVHREAHGNVADEIIEVTEGR